MVTLENWYMIESPSTRGHYYLAPEQRKFRLCGQVYNHPEINDGSWIESTRIISMTDTMAVTKNTTYILNTQFKNYKKGEEQVSLTHSNP
jgi:hypothetical protein